MLLEQKKANQKAKGAAVKFGSSSMPALQPPKEIEAVVQKLRSWLKANDPHQASNLSPNEDIACSRAGSGFLLQTTVADKLVAKLANYFSLSEEFNSCLRICGLRFNADFEWLPSKPNYAWLSLKLRFHRSKKVETLTKLEN